MSYSYTKDVEHKRRQNLMDMAASLDLLNVFIRLKMILKEETEDIAAQFTIIKYRSHGAINDIHFGGKK